MFLDRLKFPIHPERGVGRNSSKTHQDFRSGGLLRNIFAPILAGSSTVCCAAFDPNLFWSVVDRIQPTWYYASPTMHSLILASAPESPSANKSRFRLICNAAGGLLPSLALQLKEVFGCTVLPSYGMTE